MTHRIATTTMTPIGMTRRAWSHRDPFLSPAMGTRAEGNTLHPLRYWLGRDLKE